MASVHAYLKLIRVKNSVMTSIAVLVGALAVRGDILNANLIYAAVSAFLIAAASFVINDLCDRKLDKSSGRENPLNDGTVSPDQAATIALSFSLAAVAVSWLTDSPLTIFLAGFSAFLAFFYSVYLKPRHATIGHLATSYSTGITYIYGWSAFAPLSLATFGAVFFMFAISMTANFSRELIKIIVDFRGDSRWGIRTLAVTRGTKFAAKAALTAMALAVALSYLPALLGIFQTSYVVIVSFVDLLLIFSAVIVYLRPTTGTAVRVKDDVLMAMALGLIAFAVGPRFSFDSIVALPFEILAILAFFVLVIRRSGRTRWPFIVRR
jgi:4-hydroxybenzoate polyprenyltransferase